MYRSPHNFVQGKGISLLKLIADLEKKHKIAPHSEAKVIWDEFVIYYKAVLENFGDVPYIPVIEDLEIVEHSNSGEVIQIMKTTIQGVEDALDGNPIETKVKHHWTRQEKIGLASLGVGISGVLLFFLFSLFL